MFVSIFRILLVLHYGFYLTMPGDDQIRWKHAPVYHDCNNNSLLGTIGKMLYDFCLQLLLFDAAPIKGGVVCALFVFPFLFK